MGDEKLERPYDRRAPAGSQDGEKEGIGLSRKDAEEELAKILRSIALGTYQEQEARNPSFEEAAEEYLKWSHGNKAPKSALRDEASIKALSQKFSGFHLREITSKMVEDYKTERAQKRNQKTVNNELACLRHMLNKAIAWGWLKENPVRGVKFFRETLGMPRFLTEEEIVRLLDACERIQGWNKTARLLFSWRSIPDSERGISWLLDGVK